MLASWKLGLGVLEARLGVLESGMGVLEVRFGVLEARLSVLEAGRVAFKLHRGLKSKNHYFSNRVSMIFALPRRSKMLPGHRELFSRHMELLPGHTDLLPGHTTWRLGGRTARSWAALGWLMLAFRWSWAVPKRSGDVLGAPERESLIFQWFWEVPGGACKRRAMDAGGSWDPLIDNFQRKQCTEHRTQKTVHRTQNTEDHLFTPARRSAVADRILCKNTYTYIYIYIERERERDLYIMLEKSTKINKKPKKTE